MARFTARSRNSGKAWGYGTHTLVRLGPARLVLVLSKERASLMLVLGSRAGAWSHRLASWRPGDR